MAGWQDIAKSVAPVLAGVLPPPFNAMATVAVKAALGLSENTKEKDIEKALASASPETLLKLKEAENAFLLEMEKLEIDIERINAGDRDSARKREIETKDKVPFILAILITLGFFGMLASLVWGWGTPSKDNEAIYLMLGSLGTSWTAVIAYYFGTTASSARKTEIMAKK